MEWLEQNKEWFLSGLGIFILTIIIRIVLSRLKKNNSNSMTHHGTGNIILGDQVGHDKVLGNKIVTNKQSPPPKNKPNTNG